MHDKGPVVMQGLSRNVVIPTILISVDVIFAKDIANACGELRSELLVDVFDDRLNVVSFPQIYLFLDVFR